MKINEAKRLYIRENKEFILNKGIVECEVHYDMGVFMDMLHREGELTDEQINKITFPTLKTLKNQARKY